MRAVLIHNPVAGRRRLRHLLPHLVSELGAAGFDVEPYPTTGPADATRIAAEAAEEGRTVVFVAGGDGTLREAAAGLVGSETALAALPLGTTNVVARALGLPLSPLDAARSYAGARRQKVDAGRLGGELFLMQTSLGLDARVLARVEPRLKRFAGRAAIGAIALREWLRYSYPDIQLMADGRPDTATFAAICNLPHYAGGFRLAPSADAQDRRLDLVLFRGRGAAATLSFAADLARGRHAARADVELRRVEEVTLLAPDGIDVQIDGDALPTTLPLTVRLARRRLIILAP